MNACVPNTIEGEALGVFGVRFGGVDRVAEVVGGDDERVAVQRDAPDGRVVDDLAPRNHVSYDVTAMSKAVRADLANIDG